MPTSRQPRTDRILLYYVQAKHNDNLTLSLSSMLNTKLTKKSNLATGIMLGKSSNQHYQTLEDMLGGAIFHNINTYALGDYPNDRPTCAVRPEHSRS